MLSMVLFGLLGVWQGGPYQPLGRTPESSNKHILIPGSGSLVPREGWETSKDSCFLLPVDHSLGLTFLEPQQGDPKGPKTITLPPAWPQPLKGLAPGPSRPLSGARVLRGQGHNEALA